MSEVCREINGEPVYRLEDRFGRVSWERRTPLVWESDAIRLGGANLSRGRWQGGETYWRYAPDEEIASVQRHMPQDAWIGVEVRPRDELAEELRKLNELAPHLAALVSAKWKVDMPTNAMPDGWRFDPGEVVVSRAALSRYQDCASFVLRHVAGDFGEHGPMPEAIREVDRWCPGLAGYAVRNALAIESDRGLIQSSYPVVIEPDRGTEAIRVMTLLKCVGPTRTHVWIAKP